MGAVIVGPWDGSSGAKTEHGDKWADYYCRWADWLEKQLAEHDQPVIPVDRDSLCHFAEWYRAKEHERLKVLELEQLKRGQRQIRRPERDSHHREVSDRLIHKLVTLEKQIRRQRHGTALHTLDGLDAKTCGVLWTAGIATVEELRRHTQRRNWLIKGVGPQRRTQIIKALKSAPNEED